MTKQIKNVLNSNIDFIQLKLFDFSEKKIDREKIISERLNKNPKIENTNQKLLLDENNTENIKLYNEENEIDIKDLLTGIATEKDSEGENNEA